jgi:hypothetical protein
MLRSLRAASLALLATLLLASCDGPTSTDSSAVGGFQGNDSCPVDGAQPYSPSPPNTNGTPVGQQMPEMPHSHVPESHPVDYINDPPTSGCHYNLGVGTAPIFPGAYDRLIKPEYWIHNLEHGYIAVLYNCPTSKTVPSGGCPKDFTALRTWLKTLPPDKDLADGKGCGSAYARVIILPDITMKDKFAVVSWDWYLGMGSNLEISKVQAFYANHTGQGPEKSC